jgi:hypothetical protein
MNCPKGICPIRETLLEPNLNNSLISATRNGKEIHPDLVQNKFDLFGSNFAYFLLVSNIGVAQTKESTESFRITSPFGW